MKSFVITTRNPFSGIITFLSNTFIEPLQQQVLSNTERPVYKLIPLKYFTFLVKIRKLTSSNIIELFFDINSPPLFFSFTNIRFKFSEFNNVIIPSVLPPKTWQTY